jgi:Tfp pilus assembly protein PilF
MPAPVHRPRWRLPLLVLVLLAVLGLGAWRIVPEVQATRHFRAGRSALERDDFDSARRHFAECLKVWPHSAETHFLAARAARRGGALGAAQRELGEAARLDWVPEALALERALLRAQAGELPAVEKYLTACLAVDHPDAELIVEVLAPTYLRHYDLGRARVCGERWVELRPDSARAWCLLGDVFEREGNKPRAEAAYREAVEIDPEHSTARFGLCWMLLEARRLAEAEGHLEDLLRQRPDDPETVVLAARCDDALGRHDLAVRLLDELLAARPDHAGALAQRGRLELDSGRAKQAEPFLRRAAQKAPFDAEVLMLLVRCLKQVGTAEEVQKVEQRRQGALRDTVEVQRLMRETSRHPDDPDLRRRVGELYLRNGQPQEGLRWLAGALQVKPDHPATHRALADYFEKLGQRERAEAHRAAARGERPAPSAPWH